MLKFFLIITMIATAAVFVAGLLSMFRSGKNSKNISNKFMVWRVWLQGLALIIFAVILYIKGK
tara:strand:+ start:53894 stop:54082 length:189 start_codon:yes stop_codon:yes gene_type:complete